MPITYEIDPSREIAVVRMTGDLTAEEFRQYFSESRSDPRFSTSLKRLVIAVGVRSFPTADEVAALSTEIRRRTTEPSVRFAVVTDGPLAVGMTNMFLGQSGMSDRYATFTDEAAARAW